VGNANLGAAPLTPADALPLQERPCVAMGRKAAPTISAAKLTIWARFARHRDTRPLLQAPRNHHDTVDL